MCFYYPIRCLLPEDFALLEEPYGVAVAVLGHEGEEVGGLGTGGEVEGVAAGGGGGQLNLLGAAHDVGEVGGGDGLLARVLHVHALAEGVGVGHQRQTILHQRDAHLAGVLCVDVGGHESGVDVAGDVCQRTARYVNCCIGNSHTGG